MISLGVIAAFGIQCHTEEKAGENSIFVGCMAHVTSNFLCLLCSFICLQAVYQLSGPVCKSTWRYNPSYHTAYLLSCFVIDFLSI